MLVCRYNDFYTRTLTITIVLGVIGLGGYGKVRFADSGPQNWTSIACSSLTQQIYSVYDVLERH